MSINWARPVKQHYIMLLASFHFPIRVEKLKAENDILEVIESMENVIWKMSQ